ncbi:MAG: hypothetical protein RL153_2263 [Verrucomicrobiota bacterium]|jgi:hypothetical protein
MPWIETCIAVCLILAYLSLVCSAIQEIIAKVFRSRGHDLLKGLASLLNSPGDPQEPSPPTRRLFDQLLRNPLLTSLARDGDVLKNPPSAIEGGVFADALIQEVSRGSEELVSTLDQLMDQVCNLPVNEPARPLLLDWVEATQRAGGDLRMFRERVVAHYDRVMERVGGWYRRKVAMSLGIIAVAVAFATNADLFHITRVVASNGTLRGSLNDAVQTLARDAATTNGVPHLAAVEASLAQLPMPLGWQPHGMRPGLCGLLEKAVGILVAAAAMSLGAPFWFDVLRLLLSLAPKPGGLARGGKG